MKFNLIQIKPDYSGTGKWCAFVQRDGEDRADVDNGPHSAGFYYCPRSKPIEQGFQELRDLLIEECHQTIETLQKALKELKALELPKE